MIILFFWNFFLVEIRREKIVLIREQMFFEDRATGEGLILHKGWGHIVGVANAYVDLFGGWRSVTGLGVVSGGVGRPEGQVITQKLHDQR